MEDVRVPDEKYRMRLFF